MTVLLHEGSTSPEDQIMAEGELPFGEYCTQRQVSIDNIYAAQESGDLNAHGQALEAHAQLLRANRCAEHARLMQAELARQALEAAGVKAL